MIVKTKEELEGLQKIGSVVAEIRDTLAMAAKPGVTTKALDAIAKDIFEKHGAESAPIKDYEFPGYTCLSVNHVAAHGIPDDRPLVNGDVLNIDVSGALNGFYADTGLTLIVGDNSNETLKDLLDASYQGLMNGIDAAIAGNKVSDIGKSIFHIARQRGYEVLINLTGHGIGRALHEAPHEISNYFVRTEKTTLRKGHVLAIETFFSTQDDMVEQGDDGWAMLTEEDNRVAQFEHTVIVTENKPIIIT